MKIKYFVLLPFFMLEPLFGQAYENPLNWATSNSYSTYNSAGVTVSKSTDAQEGLYATQLEGKNAALIGKTIPGVITTGILKGGINVSGGQPYTTRSQKLTGYYKYLPQGADMAGFEVLLTKWNSTTLKRDTIAYGSVSKGAAADYTAFDVPLTYKTTDAPDTQLIVISSSADRLNAVAGSVLLVDGLSFIDEANTECAPVLASSNDGNLPENVLDNNLQTRWSAKGDGEWIQLCFGSDSIPLDGVKIALHSGTIRKTKFDISTSVQEGLWTTILAGLESSGSTLELENFDFNKIVWVKQLRITGHGNNLNTWNSITEIKPNIACIPVLASSNDGNLPENVLDNNLQTRWSANGDGQWIEFCLGTENEVDGLEIAFYNGNIRKSTFDVLTSLDRVTWTNAALGLTSSGTSTNLEKFIFNKINAKYVRIVGHGNSSNLWNSYCEVKISNDTLLAKKSITSNNNYIIDSKIFDVYPNPANDILYITVGENSIIQIFNINGSQIVYQSNVEANQMHAIDVKELTAGIYLVKVSNNKFIKTQKVVIDSN